MKIRSTLVVAIISILAVTGLRIYHLLNAIEYTTGMNKDGYFTNVLLPVVLIASLLIMFILSLAVPEYPLEFPQKKSTFSGLISILCGIAAGVDAGFQLYSSKYRLFGGTAGLVYAALGITVLMSFIFIAIACFNGINTVINTPLIMLFPIIWTGLRMVLSFLQFQNEANINESTYDIVMLAFRLLFFVFFAKFLVGAQDTSGKWMFATGAPAALTSIAAALPRYVLNYIIKNDDTGNYDMTVRTDHAFVPHYIDLAVGIFIITILFFVSQRTFVAVFAASRQGGAYVPVRQYAAVPQQQVQQQYAQPPRSMGAAAPQQQRQPAQQAARTTAQQQAAQRPTAVNPQQRMPGMPGMPGQPGMYGYPPYNNMYGYPPMYNMPGMPMYGMPGMMGMPMAPQTAAQYGAAQSAAAQQAAAAAQAGAAMQQTLLAGGGADNFTQKGAGLRVANQFHVKGDYSSHGHGSGHGRTSHGSRFSGLDDFRSNLLTGRQALEALEDNDEEEEIEEGSASEMLEDQNRELENMQQNIDDALSSAQAEFSNSAESPIETSVEISDDDGNTPEPETHAEERRNTRDVSLGSGRKKGRLADRLEQQRARRQEDLYEDEYDDEDDEYEDEDEEDYDEMEYGSDSYDYEYSNGYAPRGDFQGAAGYYDDDDEEYDDDEYDDEEYDDDEYDDEYDDEDYDDDEYDDDEYDDEEYDDDEYYGDE